MTSSNWQKSTYCGSGESCLHVVADDHAVRLTESSDPAGTILHTTAPAWAALLRAIQKGEVRA